jgi:hypothetical protein
MKNKTILLGIGMITITLLLSVNSAFAAAPNWDITGTWTFNDIWMGTPYVHSMTINAFNPTTGVFSGTGYYTGDPTLTWSITGTVDGDSINYVLTVLTVAPGVTLTGTGTVTSSTSMGGTGYQSNLPGSSPNVEWTATGTAIKLDADGDGVQDTQDFCPNTVADSRYRTLGEGMNRWIWDGSKWVTVSPTKGKGPASLFANKAISDYTYGCSCEQILTYLHANYPETYGNMVGHWKYGCSRSILEDWHNGLYYIETVAVPASKDTATLSSIALQNGKNYELKAYGTATACWEPGCQITFDAEYSTSDGTTWVDGVAAPYDGYGTNLLDLMVNGGYVDWGAYNSAHTYWLPVTGTGSTLPLQVYDIYYPNNAGNLNVDIYAKLW